MFRGSHDGLMIDGLASEPQSAVRVARFTLRTDYVRRVSAAPDQLERTGRREAADPVPGLFDG